MKRRTLIVAASLAALTGCSLAPHYQAPDVPQPQAFDTLPAGWKAAEPADAQSRGAWWRQFGDAQLDALEARVDVSNQNLQAALARLDQARAAAGIARAPLLPTLTANVAASRSRISENTTRHAAGTSPLANDYLLGAALGYELDLWGRLRNAADAGTARAAASVADLETLRLSLHAELAADYFALRGHEQTQALLTEAGDALARALALSERRQAGGLVSEIEVNQWRVQIETTRAAIEDSRLRQAQLLHAIAVLVGAPAPGFHIAAGPLPSQAPTIPSALPSALLERRPDVAAAERRAFAANADIGIARAAYFPSFSIGAAAGYEANRQASWIEAPSRFWAIGPQLLLNLFDGGRIAGGVEQARAAFDEAGANYRQTVLNAYRESEDSLAATRHYDAALTDQQAAAAAAARTFAQIRRQFDGGLVSYLPLALSHLAALQAQQSVVALQVAQLNARLQLFKALGGGWHGARPDGGE